MTLLMHIAIKCIQFRVNNTMYQEIDSIMSSSLGAAMANIDADFLEEKLFEITDKPLYYAWYVDNTFVIFFRSESRQSFHSLNQLHPVLKFTFEFENNDSLLFLDLLVERTNLGFLTSIC